jgi:hypothetical protein
MAEETFVFSAIRSKVDSMRKNADRLVGDATKPRYVVSADLRHDIFLQDCDAIICSPEMCYSIVDLLGSSSIIGTREIAGIEYCELTVLGKVARRIVVVGTEHCEDEYFLVELKSPTGNITHRVGVLA